jgi:hypothetical protein
MQIGYLLILKAHLTTFLSPFHGFLSVSALYEQHQIAPRQLTFFKCRCTKSTLFQPFVILRLRFRNTNTSPLVGWRCITEQPSHKAHRMIFSYRNGPRKDRNGEKILMKTWYYNRISCDIRERSRGTFSLTPVG